MPNEHSKTTNDPQTIREWVEERNGFPAKVVGTGDDDPARGGVLRIDFNMPEENLERITWEEFFEIFDARNLSFLYQEETADGSISRFYKFIASDEA